MVSTRPTTRQLELDFSDEDGPGQAAPEPQRGQSLSAIMTANTLGIGSVDLMERVVDPDNIERAWRNVKANRGAPGPDGITLGEFPETIRELWPEVRQQLLEGTYWPGAARRKSIPKTDGGTRDLGIPNVIERLIQQAVMQVLTPIFDPHFSEIELRLSTGLFRTWSNQADSSDDACRLSLLRGYGPVYIFRQSPA